MLDFTDKVVLVTGGGGRIGAETADLFVKQGARVVSTDISFATPPTKQFDFRTNPVKLPLDVADVTAVGTIIDTIMKTFGQLDVVVNAAGILNTRPLLELTERDWGRSLAVNLKGTFFVCQAALANMIAQRNGAIVNIASISGKVGGILAGADYSASKAAVISLTKSLAKAGAAYGVRVNSVAPGAIRTPMLNQYYENFAEQMKAAETNHPLGRFGEALEVASAVLFLASDAASYITGTCLDVNGGSLMD